MAASEVAWLQLQMIRGTILHKADWRRGFNCSGIKPDDDVPSVQPHYRTFFPITAVSAPVLRIGTLILTATGRLDFSLRIGTTGSCVPYRSPSQGHAAFMPDAGWQSAGTSQPLLAGSKSNPGFDVDYVTTRHQRFTPVRLLETHLTEYSFRLFPQRSPPGLFTLAACGGLEPAPASRLRRALPHLR